MIRKQRYPKLKQCRPFQHGFKVPLWTVNGMSVHPHPGCDRATSAHPEFSWCRHR